MNEHVQSSIKRRPTKFDILEIDYFTSGYKYTIKSTCNGNLYL